MLTQNALQICQIVSLKNFEYVNHVRDKPTLQYYANFEESFVQDRTNQSFLKNWLKEYLKNW